MDLSGVVNRFKSGATRLQSAISSKINGSKYPDAREESPSWFERVFSYKRLAIALFVMVLSVVIALTVLMVMHFRFRSCELWLSDISILKLPAGPQLPSGDGDPQVTIQVALLLQIYNPTQSTGSMKHSSFRLSFVDYINNVTYTANQQVRYPAPNTYCPQGADAVTLPPSSTQQASLQSNLTILNAAVKVAHLLSHGCFGIHATGQVSYDVGIRGYSSELTRSFQLFADGACPCPA
eukprot:TRINITY_DN22345_c0_g1_i1.p1 TRINITY_DN22345_c0_g1~~TRINITY_DN22345_c0_g1_i1.p1  ORF type:complete len:237 (+),score=40.17 TRINITY_DN22345_c0_g1_i1:226-936(+)